MLFQYRYVNHSLIALNDTNVMMYELV